MLGRVGADGSLFHLRLPADPFALLERHGHVPLPPYITHADSADDAAALPDRVRARAPARWPRPPRRCTSTPACSTRWRARGVQRAGVTLHVGAGTFQPVRSDDLAEHRMHSEWYEVPAGHRGRRSRDARARGGRVVAVGTTTVRALESAALAAATQALASGAARPTSSSRPAFEFRVVDRLITNFHLPKSTLLMLVSAFAGHEHMMALYRHAIEARYRFFSYGDAMLLARQRLANPACCSSNS